MGTPRKCQDHKGREFDSLKSMCCEWNITCAMYAYRKRQGWDLKRILETPVLNTNPHFKEFYDPETGITYKSMAEFTRQTGISKGCIRYRRRVGMSQELMTYKNSLRDVASQDHLGHTFRNMRKMCEHWHIPHSTFLSRRHNGWSVEKALTTPIRDNGQKGRKKYA